MLALIFDPTHADEPAWWNSLRREIGVLGSAPQENTPEAELSNPGNSRVPR